MKSKLIVVGGVTVAFLITLLLIGASPASRAPTEWEYGVYVESANNYEWQEAGQRVQATTVDLFFERMSLPADIRVDARTGRVPGVFLNQLGRRGWELVDVVADTRQNTYWFKRPR
jgi:hypothetical protein